VKRTTGTLLHEPCSVSKVEVTDLNGFSHNIWCLSYRRLQHEGVPRPYIVWGGGKGIAVGAGETSGLLWPQPCGT
jgi:hypothetical protein